MNSHSPLLQFWAGSPRAGQHQGPMLVFQILFWLSAVYVAWGGYVELAKALGWTFHALLPVAALVLLLWLMVVIRAGVQVCRLIDRDWTSARFLSVVTTTLVSLVLVWLTYRNVHGGSDFLVYAVGPAFHQAAPDLPLTLGMAGRLEFGQVGSYGYLLPYVLEYLLAAISTLLGVPIVELGLVWQPMLALFLMPWVVLALLRILGATAYTATGLLLLFFLMAVMDSGSMLSWGFNSLGRVYENKGILYALGIPALMLFLLVAVTEGGGRWNVLALGVLSSALCFVTPNSIYLVPFVSGSVLVSVYGLQWAARFFQLSDSLVKIEFAKALWLFLASVVAPLLFMLVIQLVDGISVYQFVNLGHFERFEYQFYVVFGAYNWAVWTGVGLSLVALLIWGSAHGRVMGLATILMASFALNEWLFDYLIAHGRGEAAVFWRFMLVMPVTLIPVVAVAGVQQDALRGKIISWVALILVLSGFIYTSMGDGKQARNVFKLDQVQTLEDFTQGHLTAEEHRIRGYQLFGESLLGFSPKAALRAAVAIGGLKVVAGKGPSLYWQQLQLDNADEIEDVFQSMYYLQGVKDSNPSALARVVERISPGLILMRNGDDAAAERDQFIHSLGYEMIQQTHYWVLYAHPRLESKQ